MSNLIKSIAVSAFLILLGCNNKPSLQQYFVQNQNNASFVAVDIAPSILNLDKAKLTSKETEVLASFEKMNVLAFKVSKSNKNNYQTEFSKLAKIVSDTTTYHQLIKFGSKIEGASISFVGNEDQINEFVIIANQKDRGFAVARILGNNMKAENAMSLFSILQKSVIDKKQIDILKNIMQ